MGKISGNAFSIYNIRNWTACIVKWCNSWISYHKGFGQRTKIKKEAILFQTVFSQNAIRKKEKRSVAAKLRITVSKVIDDSFSCPARKSGYCNHVMTLLLEPQSFIKYLRLTLVFMWSSALREKFNFCFSRAFASIDKISILTGRLGALGYHSMKFRHFLDYS